MSEMQPQMPEDLNQFSALEARNYSNGANHIYGVGENGKKVHLKGDNVLAAYGYTDADLPANNSDVTTPTPVETPSVETTPESADQSLYDEYSAAVKDESATIRVKNAETGKMEEKKVKDMNFREWTKAVESRKAARWYTATRAHGEVPEGEIGDLGNGDAAGSLADREDAERVNGQEGKDHPSEDDVDYYRWLKKGSGKSNDDGGSGSGDGNGDGNGDDDGGGNGDDGTPEEVPTEPTPEIQLPPEMGERLNVARDRYVRLNARRRGLIFGRRNKKELAEAKAEYEAARDLAGQFAAGELTRAGADAAEVQTFATMGAAQELCDVTQMIYDRQIEGADAKKLKGFYDWWARQGGRFFTKAGFKGAIKKAGVMAIPMAAVGAAAGAVGITLLGPIAGALAGAGVARGVARGLMGAHVNKNAEAARVAGEQRDEQILSDDTRLSPRVLNGEILETKDITEGIQDLTDRSIRRNRRRTALAVGVAAAAGVAGTALGSHFFGGGGGKHVPGGGKHTPTGGSPKPPVTPTIPKPPIDNGGIVEATPTFPKIDIVPTDGRLPWTHAAGIVGRGEATRNIMEMYAKAKTLGIDIQGHKVPGVNNDVIDRIVMPDGRVYTGNANINAMIDAVRNYNAPTL